MCNPVGKSKVLTCSNNYYTDIGKILEKNCRALIKLNFLGHREHLVCCIQLLGLFSFTVLKPMCVLKKNVSRLMKIVFTAYDN